MDYDQCLSNRGSYWNGKNNVIYNVNVCAYMFFLNLVLMKLYIYIYTHTVCVTLNLHFKDYSLNLLN